MRGLTRLVVDFFSGGPYRFLVLLVAGASIMGYASYVMLFVEPQPADTKVLLIASACFFLYAGGGCWYAWLIHRGKWEALWDHIQSSLDKFDDLGN